MLVSAQCKTAGHGPYLFQCGTGVGNTVQLRLQSYHVKLLAMVLIYSSGVGLGITVIFGPKHFSQPRQLSRR